MSSPKQYYKSILPIFEAHRNDKKAKAMAAYLRNQFDFYGIQSPLRRSLQKEIFTQQGKPLGDELKAIVQLCWADKHRELQHFAMDLMLKSIKELDDSFIPFIEKLILQKSWWDTVDWLAPTGIGMILKRYPHLIQPLTSRWIEDDNIWLQRSAILFQLKYKSETNVELMSQYILRRADSKEFFVQKAAGWMLRQYSREDADFVRQFIANNELPSLTKREGLKWLNRQ